jgi:small subunit ribosomal protein S8
MSVTDPIADFLTRIRNAQMALHESMSVSHSKSKEELVKILKEEGYINGFKIEEGNPFKSISIVLKYVGDREPAIRALKRISKPGRRVYVRNDQIPTVLGGLGINILSTSQGILTGKNARSQGVGGELLCEIY